MKTDEAPCSNNDMLPCHSLLFITYLPEMAPSTPSESGNVPWIRKAGWWHIWMIISRWRRQEYQKRDNVGMKFHWNLICLHCSVCSPYKMPNNSFKNHLLFYLVSTISAVADPENILEKKIKKKYMPAFAYWDTHLRNIVPPWPWGSEFILKLNGCY